jgi:hypothetical protein
MEQASRHYEGLKCNLDHPELRAIKSPRSVKDYIGNFANVEVRPDGVFGDLHLLRSHPNTNQILEVAERCPNQLGFSHNADCDGTFDGSGKQTIDGIHTVRSVDIVQRPGTTNGLYEMDGMAGNGSVDATLANTTTGGGCDYNPECSVCDQISAILTKPGMGDSQRLEAIKLLLPDTDNTMESVGKPQYKSRRQAFAESSAESALGYAGGSKGLAALVNGRTPRRASSSVTESTGPSALGYTGGAKGLAAALK